MPGAPVVFIVGPTASGKTAAALALARTGRWPLEIVNADSRQVYRRMSIGTAKPTPDELAEVPHHLIDVADPAGGFSLVAFLTQARASIADIQGRSHLPVVVGGTGQYVWGLVEGWQVPRVPPQPQLRARLEREARESGPTALHARLAEIDPGAAALIDPNNARRLVRALEVWETTGELFSAQRRRSEPPFDPVLFGVDVPRGQLYSRIDARVDAMIDAGWIDEVRGLLDAGCTPDMPAFSSVGYREIAAYLAGDLSLEQAIAKIKTSTHRLARRQAAWFRRDDPRITWAPDTVALVAAVEQSLART